MKNWAGCIAYLFGMNKQSLSCLTLKPVKVGLVWWHQISRNRLSYLSLLGLRHVPKSKRKGFNCSARPANGQLVVSWCQVDEYLAVPLCGIAQIKASVIDQRSTRAGQCPSNLGTVG